MSDGADYDFDQGFDGWNDHLNEECDPVSCPYCAEDEEKQRKPGRRLGKEGGDGSK